MPSIASPLIRGLVLLGNPLFELPPDQLPAFLFTHELMSQCAVAADEKPLTRHAEQHAMTDQRVCDQFEGWENGVHYPRNHYPPIVFYILAINYSGNWQPKGGSGLGPSLKGGKWHRSRHFPHLRIWGQGFTRRTLRRGLSSPSYQYSSCT